MVRGLSYNEAHEMDCGTILAREFLDDERLERLVCYCDTPQTHLWGSLIIDIEIMQACIASLLYRYSSRLCLC